MNRLLNCLLIFGLLLGTALPVVAQDENTSAGRELGFGIQWTGEVFGLSVRYWFNESMAAELDFFFLPGWVADIAVRGLMKPQLESWAFDTPKTDFYVGAGIGLLDVADEERSSFYFQGFAGIESNPNHTQAWNMEMGIDYLAEFIQEGVDRLTVMTFGLGVHLYP